MTNDSPLSQSQLRVLKRLFPEDGLLLSPEETLIFGTDRSKKFAAPAAVVRPESVEQVSELLAFAHAERIPVSSRGRGTNSVGGCVPDRGGVVLCTARLNSILEISSSDFVALVQPGVITGDLQEACAAKRLFYPPDPASAKFSTIGGNLAMNAGGMSAVKYGCTKDFVLGLTLVLPGGKIIRTGSRCHKDVAGLDLVRLFVGSEGTLGFIAEATLKLLPLPESQASLLVAFASQELALNAAAAVFAAGLLPTAMEFMPKEVLEALANVGLTPWPASAHTSLLFKLDGSEGSVTAELALLRGVMESFSPVFLDVALTPDKENGLWEVRRQISQATSTIAPNKFSDDIAVPRGKVGEAIERIRAIGEHAGIKTLVFGHLGDGNLHVNLMYDASNEDEARRAQAAKAEVLEMALSLGGTISGEHGIGLNKVGWLPRKAGDDAVALMHQIKAVFDPHGIMNPGKAY
ncbi:MAG: FAD-binding protein [Desulfovibrio sp.]|nr:FAD-binding protein [Desulfovibrio sp.]MBI4958041.1 FAD-binding protein [Desulfovibrio sp.]